MGVKRPIKLNDQYKQTDVYLLKSIFTSTCIDYSMYFDVFKLSSCFHFHTIHPLCCLHKRTVRLMLKSCVENVIPMCVVAFTGVCEKNQLFIVGIGAVENGSTKTWTSCFLCVLFGESSERHVGHVADVQNTSWLTQKHICSAFFFHAAFVLVPPHVVTRQ